MSECQNCGSFVTERYVRVFEPEGVTRPRACPHCEDMLRRGATADEKRTVPRS